MPRFRYFLTETNSPKNIFTIENTRRVSPSEERKTNLISIRYIATSVQTFFVIINRYISWLTNLNKMRVFLYGHYFLFENFPCRNQTVSVHRFTQLSIWTYLLILTFSRAFLSSLVSTYAIVHIKTKYRQEILIRFTLCLL